VRDTLPSVLSRMAGGAPRSKLLGIHLKINSGFYEVGKSEIFVISVPSYFFLILLAFLVKVFASFIFSLHQAQSVNIKWNVI